MKERHLIFPFDDADGIGEKIVWLQKFIGKNNVCTEGLVNTIPEVVIRCDKKKWKDIRFKLDLYKCFY